MPKLLAEIDGWKLTQDDQGAYTIRDDEGNPIGRYKDAVMLGTHLILSLQEIYRHRTGGNLEGRA